MPISASSALTCLFRSEATTRSLTAEARSSHATCPQLTSMSDREHGQQRTKEWKSGRTHLEKSISVPQSSRELTEHGVQPRRRVALEQFGLVQLEDRERDAEKKNGPVDEEQVPDAAAYS